MAIIKSNAPAVFVIIAGTIIAGIMSVPTMRTQIALNSCESGQSALYAGNYKTAEASFRKSLSTLPDLRPAQLGLGDALYFQGDYDHALRVLEEVNQGGVNQYPSAHYYRGEIYDKLGLKAEAIAEWRIVTRLFDSGWQRKAEKRLREVGAGSEEKG